MKSWLAAALITWGIAAGAQEISVTGNLVVPTTQSSGSTWTNGVYQDSLTCWAWGDPGYCGPNPIVGPTGTINYSFGWTDIYQQQSITNLLPDSGTGLLITGYNFGFMAKNGNGWDDGRTDLLFAYVQFNDPKNSTLFNHTHNLSYQFNWTAFNYNENFATPYRTADIGTVRYGFVGQDNNFWAGPYGPEIMNVSFSLKYTPDPCVTNPLSSPSCPGFAAALASLTLVPPVSTAEPVASSTPTATTTAAVAAPASTVNAAEAPAERTPVMMSPRLLNIVRSVNEAVAATVTTTVAQSIEQSQSAAATQDLALIDNISASGRALGGSISTMTPESDAGAGALTRPGDPVATARSGRTVITQEDVQEEKQQARVAPPPPAELAGGVSMVALAQGADLTAYTQARLRDAQFYAPREIYRGQAVVDNRSVLRGLGSDALHDRMVEQQYRK